MNNSREYKTATKKELKVRACDKNGNPLAKDVKMELPELREFLTKVYTAHLHLADNVS